MYDYSSPYGESCYRLMARTGHFIYLRTRGYLDIDRDTNQVRSFVCHNTLVDEEEGKKLVNEMKKKFAIMIQETDFSTSTETEAAVENPEQIVDAVLSLVTDLQGPDSVASPTVAPSPHRGDAFDADRGVTSPPLSIIAPNPLTIKNSITKSVTVLGPAAKCMKYSVRRAEELRTVEVSSNGKSSNGGGKRWRPSNGDSPTQQMYNSKVVDCRAGNGHTPTIEAVHLNSRVPPLPTSAGYFDSIDYQPSSSGMCSPPEYKPFDIINDSQLYLPTSTTTDGFEPVNVTMSHDIKRPHNDDDYDGEMKRRYCGSTTILQDSCIDDLINPDLGRRGCKKN